jgi:ectoine hydroxylase-related dioxygenase (phytanoyl-CoA dioxygenase family)
MDMECGDATLMDSRLWHAGGANTHPTARVRIANARIHATSRNTRT